MSYFRIEGPVALRPRLKREHQTLVGAVKREWKMGEQAALVLHKKRRYSTGVLVRRRHESNTSAYQKLKFFWIYIYLTMTL